MMYSLIPTKSECRRCTCTRKYAGSTTTTRATSKSRRSKKKRVKFPRPLQLSTTQKAAKRANENAAVLQTKLDALKPKEKLPFPTAKPQRPKLSGFVALKVAAERVAKKKAAKDAKKAAKDAKKVAKERAKTGAPIGTKGVMFDKSGKPIKAKPGAKAASARGRSRSGKGGKGRKSSKGGKKGDKPRKPRPPGWKPKPKRRVIKITYPERLRLKKWIPPYLLPWPPYPRAHVDVPPFGTRKWVPPYLRRRKPRDRLKIDYPPLTLRKWVPPYKRKRPKREKLKSLHGKSFHIDPSSLLKFWHHFLYIDDDRYFIIAGDYCQTNCKYSYKTNGYQGPCNCLVATAVSKLFPMKHWHGKFLGTVLDIGNALYMDSLRHLPADVKPNIDVDQVYKSFYFGRTKVTATLSDEPYKGKLYKDGADTELCLRDLLGRFFDHHYGGILIVGAHRPYQYRAVWRQYGKYYLFDPTEHDDRGRKWPGLPGRGHCFVAMFLVKDRLVDFVLESIDDDDENNDNFVLVPCDVLRATETITDYPQCLLEFEPPPTTKPKRAARDKELHEREPEPEEVVVEEDEDPRWLELEEVAADAVPPDAPPRKLEIKRLVAKPKAESVTCFSELVAGKMGILRADTHQTDPKFTRYKGQQSLANAVAALTMLRVDKSKRWTSLTLNEVLRNGETIYHESKKNKYKQEDLKFEHIIDRIALCDKEFKPVFEEMAIIGKLQSTTDTLLDLTPALREYFTDNPIGILCGPLSLAVWYEDGLFYMFDPDERDVNGNVIVRCVQVGSETVFLKDVLPGRACLTWYTDLNDLTEKYMKNLERDRRRDYFSICKVQINDYVPKYNDWNNFKGLTDNRWILRGSFGQSSKRFDKETRNTQCTAIAALALAYIKILPLEKWTSETIDEILIKGDQYYTNCVKTLKDAKKFLSPKLLVEELLRNTMLDDKEVSFEIDDCVENGVVGIIEPMKEPERKPAKNLLQGLTDFFENNDYAIVTAKSLSVAVWKFKNFYYLFDSHSLDKDGFATTFGNAAVLRYANLNDLVDCLEANFAVDESRFFNVSRIETTVRSTSDDAVSPVLKKNYKLIDDSMSILRATTSDMSEEFGFNRGKQVAANCVAAAGMANIYPPSEWSSQTIDNVLKRGDQLFMDSKKKIYEEMLEFAKLTQSKGAGDKNDPKKKAGKKRGGGTPLIDYDDSATATTMTASKVSRSPTSYSGWEYFKHRAGGFPVSLDVDPLVVDMIEDMNSDRVQTQFKIGANKIKVEFELINQGTIETDLEQKIVKYLLDPQPSLEATGDKKHLLLETDFVTYYITKDDNAYFIFTSQPCDHEGCFYGREEWKIRTPPPEFEEAEEEMEEFGSEIGEEEEEVDTLLLDENYDPDFLLKLAVGESPAGQEEDILGEEEEERLIETHSSHYWRAIAEQEGRAYVACFAQPDLLAKHILLNFPDTLKTERYSLKQILVRNTIEVKDYFNPRAADRCDPYDGDYYEFKEIERGRWILRGTFDQCHEMFPIGNRGKQTVANCLVSIAFFRLYNLTTFERATVDAILKFGDRLLTFTKRLRREHLRRTIGAEEKLTDSQIDVIVDSETAYGLNEVCRTFTIGDDRVTVDVDVDRTITGDVKVTGDDGPVLNLPRALTRFFSDEYADNTDDKDANRNRRYGLLIAKQNVCVAIARGSGGRTFYMFDPTSRGPSGLACVNGVACITRYFELEALARTFIANLPKEGSNAFFVHKILVTSQPEPPPLPTPPLPAEQQQQELVGYGTIVPGKKWIIRGTDDGQSIERFGATAQRNACLALVALAMTFVHRCSNWTGPIVDEIVRIGDDVAREQSERISFDAWQDDAPRVPNNVIVDVGNDLMADCELRETTQSGLFNVKDPNVLNLRQAIDKFFEENSHGIIDSEILTVAIWSEEDYGEGRCYVFDANPLGPTGMPLPITSSTNKDDDACNASGRDARVCVVVCRDAKIAADHLVSVLPPDSERTPFNLIPIEIVVGKKRKKRKCKSRTTAKSEKQRRESEYARNKAMLARLDRLGRCEFYDLPSEGKTDATSVLRGTKSQSSKCYGANSRGNQDVPNCFVSFVMERLLPFKKWTSTIIDSVLDIGHQLYKDSFIVNNALLPPSASPVNGGKIDLDSVIRQVVVKDVHVHLAVSRPVIFDRFAHENLLKGLEIFFLQRTSGLLGIDGDDGDWVAIYSRFEDDNRYYYMFDPHERNPFLALTARNSVDRNGRRQSLPLPPGTAVLYRCSTINALTKRLREHYPVASTFRCVVLGVKAVEKEMERTECRCGVDVKEFV